MTGGHLDDVTSGLEVVSAGGETLGSTAEIFRDADTQHPEWAVVSGTFVPLRDAELHQGQLRVPYTRDQLDAAPSADPSAGRLTRAQEADLYLHYGIGYDVTTLVQHQTGGEHGGASGQLLDVEGADDVQPETPWELREDIDPDHDVRPGVLDAGVEHRVQEQPGTSQVESAMGTGVGGTAMGTAGLRSAAGTNSNTELAERDDLTTSGGNETSSAESDARGSAMSDIVDDKP